MKVYPFSPPLPFLNGGAVVASCKLDMEKQGGDMHLSTNTGVDGVMVR